MLFNTDFDELQQSSSAFLITRWNFTAEIRLKSAKNLFFFTSGYYAENHN